MNIKEINHIKEEIKSHCSTNGYLEALKCIDSFLDKFPLFVPFLLRKAQILQMLENGYEEYGELDYIKELLKNITLIDDSYIEAKIELAFYLYNVDDNKDDALIEINNAIRICEKQLEECKNLKKEIEG